MAEKIAPAPAPTPEDLGDFAHAAYQQSPEARALAPEVVNESNEDAAEVQANETLRTDAQILGGRYRVIEAVKNTGDLRVKEFMSKTKENAGDRIGLAGASIALKLAESSLNRRRSKMNEVAHLGNNHPLVERRLKKLFRAEARYNKHKAKVEARKNRISSRNETYKRGLEARFSENRHELAEKRRAALARKATRQELREQGAGWLERHQTAKEHVKSISSTEKSRIANALITAAEAAKSSKEAGKYLKMAQKTEVEKKENYASVERDLEIARGELRFLNLGREAMARKENIVLPELREKVAQLEQRATSLPEDHPDKFSAMNELVEARNELENTEKTVKEYNESLTEAREREWSLRQSLQQAYIHAEGAKNSVAATAYSARAANFQAATAREQQSAAVNRTFRK